MKKKRLGFGVRFVLVLLAATAAGAWAASPSVEEMFSKPDYLGATLSPTGRYLAIIAPVDGGRRGIAIIDLESRNAVAKFAAGDMDVVRVAWQTDERMIVFPGDLQRVAGDARSQAGMVAVDRNGGSQRVLATRGFERPGSVAFLRTIPASSEVLITARESSRQSLDLYRYDTLTGARTLLSFESPGHVSRWVVDFDGVPRAAVTDDVVSDVSAWYVRRGRQDAWTKVEEAKLGRLDSYPLQFDPDGKLLYVAARRDGDRSAVYEYDVDAGRWGKAIATHPDRDLDASTVRFVADYERRKLLGLRYIGDRPAAVWFDAEWARIQKSIDAALPDTINDLQGVNSKRWIVVAHSDRNAGEAYLFDASTARLEKLFSYRRGVDPRTATPARWVRYHARDGLAIPALLTVPANAAGHRVPLVVDIHGGPHVPANVWGYNREVQFFASRGYAVLQPQFRGTRGFGSKHLTSGYREWGFAMQDDLEDGVKWAVAEGIADAGHVCYYGGSYGGFAAIIGTIKSAGLVRCAVAIAAPTSIDYLFDSNETDLSRLADRSTLMQSQIGDPRTDRARWKSINPIDNADKVSAPILLAYGIADVRVPLAHGNDFRSALDRFHKPYEWVTYGGEGHGFNSDENVFDFYRRVEQFLAKYLNDENGSGTSPATPATPSKD